MAEFWGTIKVWSQKPHVVNKRLAGVASVASWKCVSEFSSWEQIVDKHVELIGQDELGIMREMKKLMWEKAEHWTVEEQEENVCFASLRKCLPKQARRHQSLFELEIIGVYTFICHQFILYY